MNNRRTPQAIAGLGVMALAASLLCGADRERQPPRASPLQESLEKARVDGKYAMLLRQIKVEKDIEKVGAFRDGGARPTTEYAGFKDLPPGDWVYVYPYWYIWRDQTDKPQAKRNWGPEQATGPPDTTGPGDIVTAWASATPDGQDEWLLLEYAEPVLPAAVLVHETYNPGALQRVTAFKLDGEEVELWKGKDPTAVGAGQGVSEVKFDASFKTNRIKIYLDSKAVAGWNEIDAVGLRDAAGKTQWATAADASSTYAQQGGQVFIVPGGPAPAPVALPAPPFIIAPPRPAAPVAPGPCPIVIAPPPLALPVNPGGDDVPAAPVDEKDERIKKLEEENKELTDRLKALEDRLREKKR